MPQRILIAEDNPAVRNALRTLLEGAGSWEILEVENGQQAIAKAPELKPNLIILDLVMPVMDGLSAARQISKLLPEIPISPLDDADGIYPEVLKAQLSSSCHGMPESRWEVRKIRQPQKHHSEVK